MNESQEPETVVCCLRCRSRSQRETARPERGSGKSDDGLPPCSPHLASLTGACGEWWRGQTLISEHIIGIINNFSTCSPDTRWRKIEHNTQRIVEKCVIMTSVRVSGTVSPQDCIFSGEKGKRGIMLKQMWLLQVYTCFRENFYRCFLISWDNTWTHKILTRKWRDNACTRAAERA